MKNGIFLTLFIFLGVLATSFAQSLPDYLPKDGLVGWWPFNGNANDESSNGIDGVVNGPVLSPDRFGNSINAYLFNGINNEIIIPNSFLTEIDSLFSVSIWFKADDNTDHQSLFLRQSLNGSRTWLMLYDNFNFIRCYNDNGNYTSATIPYSIYGGWHHLGVVYDRNKIITYFDGKLIVQQSLPTSFTWYGENVIIGGTSGTGIGNYPFLGSIDDIGIWNRALTEEEILKLYESKNSYTCDTESIRKSNLNYGSVTDIDGNVYSTIKIGEQEWMAENLRTTRYANGDTIPKISDFQSWASDNKGAWSYPVNDSTYNCPYGKFYNGYVVLNSKNVCPSGWHIPTVGDWQELEYHLVGNGYNWDGTKSENKIAKSVCSSNTWASSLGEGTIGNMMNLNNSSGFSGVATGNRDHNGAFGSPGDWANWWTSTRNCSGDLMARKLVKFTQTLGEGPQSPKWGYSIRCVKGPEQIVAKTACVSTVPVTKIDQTNSASGGNITADGGAEIINRGLVWSTTPNPTIVLPTKTSEGNGVGEFTSKITGLLPGTKYYIRAYATNDAGTAYGNELTFTTRGACLPDYVPTDGLAGFWPFCGNANDESGNGNDGVVNGATLAEDRFGNENEAFSFDGLNSFIKISNPKLPLQNSSRTFSAWVYLTPTNGYNDGYGILSYGSKSPSNGMLNDLFVKEQLLEYNTHMYWADYTPINKFNGKWSHIVVTYENSNINNINLYIDGIIIPKAINNPGEVSILDTKESDLLIGKVLNAYASEFFFNGKLDDIGIWNRALTEQEIKQLYLGESNAIQCDKSIVHGTLQQGVSADGMKLSIPYTNGDGSQYAELLLNSEGVSGLTATLHPGNFADGNGLLSFGLSGIPDTTGSALFNLELAGQSCSFTVDVVKNAYSAESVFCSGKPTAVIDVTNPKTGRIWMDRNLGASRVATSLADANAFGDMYQWGRRADGHQCRNSGTINILSNVDQPTHGDFILKIGSPFDWRDPHNDNLWQGTNGLNNPCPAGYRLPTDSELNEERISWSTNNSEGAFASPLKLSNAGYRLQYDGMIDGIGNVGEYWSSTVSGFVSKHLSFNFNTAGNGEHGRALGWTVRCIKETSVSIGSIDCSGYETIGTLTDGIQSSGVTIVLPYQQGNGGFYPEQTFTSSGVSGLTASLSSGIFAEGAGNLTFEITGVPQGAGTAEFNIFIGGKSCKLSVEVLSNPSLVLTLTMDTITGRRGDVVVLPVRVKNFTDILSGQMSVTFDPAIVTLAGVENFGTDSITQASFNLADAASGRLSFLWTQNDNIPISLSDGDTLFAMRFKVLGRNTEFSDVRFTTSPLSVEFVDASLNAVDNVVLQNGRINAFSENVLSGQLRTETGQGIRSATLAASGGSNASTTSALSGQYALTLPELTSIKVTPAKANDTVVTNGITIADVIRMQRHILGSVPLESPYKIIAADVNHSGTITGLDVVLVNALILGRLSTYPGGRLWSFVPTSHTFANPQQPFPYPNYRGYTDFSGAANADFIGMKLGDVDNSYIPSQGRNPSSDTVTIYTEDQQVPTGATEVSVPVRVSDFESISGFQFGVQWDPAVLKYKGAEKAAAMSAADLGTDYTESGHLNVAWFHPTGLWTTLSDGTAIMELIFETVGTPGSTSTVGVFDSPTTPVEIIQDDLSPASAVINSGIIALGTPSSAQDAGAKGMQVSVHPNPFSEELHIEIQHAAISGIGVLSVYDEAGRQIYHEEVRIEKGLTRHATGAGLPAGTYTLRLEDLDGRIIKQQKAIKIR